MARRILLIAALITALAVAFSGCATLLEDYKLEVTPRSAVPEERLRQEPAVEITSYDELKAEIMGLVVRHEGSGRMVAYTYDGNITEDITRVRQEIMKEDPLGSYAVADISGVTTRMVTYSEIVVSVSFKRTEQQVESIVNVSTLRYLRTELLRVLSECHDAAVFRTSLQITPEAILWTVEDLYYQNPRSIVMLPVTVVGIFPGYGGEERIYELRFGYPDESSILRHYAASLALYVRSNAEYATGDNDAEILLSLAENLIEASYFNLYAARSISSHGAQNLAATAYGALVSGRAAGEGFAMAFKALCDELRFECFVVLGQLDGMIHAWNIVSLYGENYHIDVAMGDLDGIETAFLKTDEDMEERYVWEKESTVRCNGTLTYEDIVTPEEPEVNEGSEEGGETEEPDAEDSGGEAPDATADGTGGENVRQNEATAEMSRLPDDLVET